MHASLRIKLSLSIVRDAFRLFGFRRPTLTIFGNEKPWFDSEPRLQLQVALLQQVADSKEASASEIDTPAADRKYSGKTRRN
jgi:hypothetical protein